MADTMKERSSNRALGIGGGRKGPRARPNGTGGNYLCGICKKPFTDIAKLRSHQGKCKGETR